LAAVDRRRLLIVALLRRGGARDTQKNGRTGAQKARGIQTECSCHDFQNSLDLQPSAGGCPFMQVR
jgi:hypothetical protein